MIRPLFRYKIDNLIVQITSLNNCQEWKKTNNDNPPCRNKLSFRSKECTAENYDDLS